MNTFMRAGYWLLVALVCVACAGPAPRQDGPAAVGTGLREILVTFTDRGLTRTSNTSPGTYVHRGTGYRSTAWSRSVSAAIARDYALKTLAEWPVRSLGVHCVVYAIEDDRAAEDVITRLEQDRRVDGVQRMNRFDTMSSEDPYKPLQTSLGAMDVETVHRWTTGKHVSVAIIDTGVDVGHPDLAGQVLEHQDLTDSASNFDDDIHGTAVAGIIGAVSQNGVGIEGIAPDARLIALRACWQERPGEIAAVCNSFTLAKALDTAIDLKPRIVNLSLTGPRDPLIEALVATALRAGIIVVTAEPEREETAGFASAIPGVIRVRAGELQGMPEDSATVFAPGSDVLTTFPHGTYNFASGSSFAAANVSGVVALLLELKPGLSPRQAGRLLAAEMRATAAADPLGARLNVCRIIERLRPEVTCGGDRLSTGSVPEPI